MAKILVIGAGGQLGTELTKALAETYGNEAVIATDFQESVKNIFKTKTLEPINKFKENTNEKKYSSTGFWFGVLYRKCPNGYWYNYTKSFS